MESIDRLLLHFLLLAYLFLFSFPPLFINSIFAEGRECNHAKITRSFVHMYVRCYTRVWACVSLRLYTGLRVQCGRNEVVSWLVIFEIFPHLRKKISRQQMSLTSTLIASVLDCVVFCTLVSCDLRSRRGSANIRVTRTCNTRYICVSITFSARYFKK